MSTETITISKKATENFKKDVLSGLSATPKYLQSKYFYDAEGDELFQQIMDMPEYYLTDCELEIFSKKTSELVASIDVEQPFDLIELGAGDAMKSSHLLQYLVSQKTDFTYLPIDISLHTIELLHDTLPLKIPGLKMKGLNGDYFDMLTEAYKYSDNPKVILLLGANIGNMSPADARQFATRLRKYMKPGDVLVMGIDLKKNPHIILDAYNDKGGITRRFNLNLLKRINSELQGNFNLEKFDHYESYDPQTGSCKSYLISLDDQTVTIGNDKVNFSKNEYIAMEISQKYSLEEIDALASATGFKNKSRLFDSKKWFVDEIWEVA